MQFSSACRAGCSTCNSFLFIISAMPFFSPTTKDDFDNYLILFVTVILVNCSQKIITQNCFRRQWYQFRLNSVKSVFYKQRLTTLAKKKYENILIGSFGPYLRKSFNERYFSNHCLVLNGNCNLIITSTNLLDNLFRITTRVGDSLSYDSPSALLDNIPGSFSNV